MEVGWTFLLARGVRGVQRSGRLSWHANWPECSCVTAARGPEGQRNRNSTRRRRRYRKSPELWAALVCNRAGTATASGSCPNGWRRARWRRPRRPIRPAQCPPRRLAPARAHSHKTTWIIYGSGLLSAISGFRTSEMRKNIIFKCLSVHLFIYPC